GPPAVARIDQAHGLHRAEAQGFAAAARQLFDRQAGFEKGRPVFFDVGGYTLACEQRVEEALVLLPVERAVKVIVGALERLAMARRTKGDALVDAVRLHNRADAVVEEQAARAGEPPDLGG